MEHIIAETLLDAPLSEEEDSRKAKEIDMSLEKSDSRWLRSFYSKYRCHIICEFEAPDVETVSSAYSDAGLPVNNIWSAEVYEGETVRAG